MKTRVQNYTNFSFWKIDLLHHVWRSNSACFILINKICRPRGSMSVTKIQVENLNCTNLQVFFRYIHRWISHFSKSNLLASSFQPIVRLLPFPTSTTSQVTTTKLVGSFRKEKIQTHAYILKTLWEVCLFWFNVFHIALFSCCHKYAARNTIKKSVNDEKA